MKLSRYSGPEVKALRKARRLNQSRFWGALGVNQSAACRYEQGREIPEPVQLLLNLALSPEKMAAAQLKELRATFAPKEGGAVRVPPEFGVLP